MNKNKLTRTSWNKMKARCNNPNEINFERYGGKGVSVCDRWQESFESFLEDMGERPSDKHSIDRIDSSRNYEPNNCRWATNKEQARNRSVARILTINGISKSVAEWSEETGVKSGSIFNRLNYGFSDYDAVFYVAGKFLTIDGVTKRAFEWSKISGTSKGNICKRLKRGWSDKEAVFGRQS